MNTQITEITQVTPQVISAMNMLLPQLSSSAKQLSAKELNKIIDSDCTHLLIVKKGNDYLGCLTLVTFTIPTGQRALIEDVVVDKGARGQGIGLLLIQKAIDMCKTMGIKTIDLTSRPSRVEANNLYKKTGFEQRQTNVYRYNVE